MYINRHRFLFFSPSYPFYYRTVQKLTVNPSLTSSVSSPQRDLGRHAWVSKGFIGAVVVVVVVVVVVFNSFVVAAAVVALLLLSAILLPPLLLLLGQ